MRMAVQLLRTGMGDPAEREEALEVIDRQIDSLLAAVGDVGELLRAQAGHAAPDFAAHDANLLLDIVCGRGALIRALAERNISLRCEPCAVEALVGHDPARVSALLEFLLLRAAAHAPPGAELRLALRQGEAISLHVSGAAATLASDPELLHLQDAPAADEESTLRALLMREYLRAGALALHHDGDGALALRFRAGNG
jgi:hypothetical protein